MGCSGWQHIDFQCEAITLVALTQPTALHIPPSQWETWNNGVARLRHICDKGQRLWDWGRRTDSLPSRPWVSIWQNHTCQNGFVLLLGTLMFSSMSLCVQRLRQF